MTDRSARLRFLFSRETLLALVAVLVLAGVCVMLGLWQFGRYEDRRDSAAVIETNYDAAPVALDEVLPAPRQPLPGTAEWTQVTMSGSYCTTPECVLYVRNRQLSGQVGFWQLVPFQAQDGTTLLVVRGWVPEDSGASTPDDPAAVPAGEMTLTARMRPAEPVLDREPPPGQAHSVNPTQLSSLMDLGEDGIVTQAYGELVTEEPPAERPAALPAPDTGLGPHLSYAFQWWIFALFFPAALIYRTRRQFQDLAAEEQEALSAGPSGSAPVGEVRVDGVPTGEAPVGGVPLERVPGDRVPGDREPARRDSTAPHSERDTPPGDRDSPAGPRPARHPTNNRPRRAVRTRRRGHDEEEEDALIDQQKP